MARDHEQEVREQSDSGAQRREDPGSLQSCLPGLSETELYEDVLIHSCPRSTKTASMWSLSPL